jgi:hypothetical protein
MGVLTFIKANLTIIPPNPATTIIEMDILKKIITDFGITVYEDITTR